MKIKKLNNSFNLLGYLLILPFLLFFACQEGVEDISMESESAINQDSKIVSLMKSAIKSGSDDDDQCVEFVYPIAFYAYYPSSVNIETIVIENDEELISFFDHLASVDQINIDFPFGLTSDDGEVTLIYSLTELEETLQIAVDACRGEGEFEYCDDKNKKVYVCHNGQTICISVNAIWTHLNNHEDDYKGKCDDDDDDDNGNDDD